MFLAGSPHLQYQSYRSIILRTCLASFIFGTKNGEGGGADKKNFPVYGVAFYLDFIGLRCFENPFAKIVKIKAKATRTSSQ